jgi:integrase
VTQTVAAHETPISLRSQPVRDAVPDSIPLIRLRDRVLFALTSQAGLLYADVLALTVADVDATTRPLTVRTIAGILTPEPELARLMRRYLRQAALDTGPLFPNGHTVMTMRDVDRLRLRYTRTAHTRAPARAATAG